MILYEYEIVDFSADLPLQDGRWLSEKLESALRKYEWFKGLKDDKVITSVMLDDFTLRAIKRIAADLKFIRPIDTDTENAINSLIEIAIDTLLERKYNTAITLIEATRELSLNKGKCQMKLCNPKCSYLYPKEEEQNMTIIKNARHLCRKYGRPVFHESCHPDLIRLPYCDEP